MQRERETRTHNCPSFVPYAYLLLLCALYIFLSRCDKSAAGLGLSIPLAFAADLFLQFTETYDDFVLDWYSCSGAAICLFGFLFVNLDSSGVDDDDYDGGDAKDVDGNDAVGDFQMMEDRRYDAKEENRII